MSKRISEKQRIEIVEDFVNEKTIEEISEKFNFTKLTISRTLKKNLGEEKYREIYKLNQSIKNNIISPESESKVSHKTNNLLEEVPEDLDKEHTFLEIAPIEYDIDNLPQKDLSSVSIKEVNLPKIVYLVVDNKTELIPKLLKDYVDWNFLPEKDLNRITIEIYFDLKIAKRSCFKEQKVIKVPNSDILKIVAPILIARGISRIVSTDLLIAL